jgi:methionyl-tRNA formyltransferase
LQRIAFLGSHQQSLHCFRHLLGLEGHDIVALAPNVSAQNNRADQDIKDLALEEGIPVVRIEDLSRLEFDLGVSVLFDQVLPPEIFERAASGFVNFHLGPLPRLRGSNSVLHAVRLARKENVWKFGVTLHYVEKKVDAGPIIDVSECAIFEDDTAGTLHARACDMIYELFRRNIRSLIRTEGRVPARKQDGAEFRFFFKNRVDHQIDLTADPLEVFDNIRALTFPGKPKPFAIIGGRKVFLSLD